MATATIAEAPADRCGPCWYADFQAHHADCPICKAAPTANDFCFVGLALLDAALGRAGLEDDPDLRWQHQNGRDAGGWTPDERRRFAIWRSVAPHPERRDAVIDLSLDLARGDTWPDSLTERRRIASRMQFQRWRLGDDLANRREPRP
jgi:hypothetical protein